MQPTAKSTPQNPDPHADPHDDIVAILRNDSSPRLAHDPSELHISLADRTASADAGPPPLHPVFRAAQLNEKLRIDNPLLDGRAPRAGRRGRGFTRFLLTVCFGIAATIGWQAYGDEALQMASSYMPQLLSAAPTTAQATTGEEQPTQTQTAEQAAPDKEKPAAVAETPPAATASASAPATTASAPTAAAPAPAAPAPTAAAPEQAAAAPDLTPVIEGMSREIASLRQSIEQLKASQQEMNRDLAKAVEEPRRKQATQPKPSPRPATTTPQRASTAPPPPPQAAADRQVYVPPPRPTERQVYVPPPPPPTGTQLPPERDYVSPRPPRPLP